MSKEKDEKLSKDKDSLKKLYDLAFNLGYKEIPPPSTISIYNEEETTVRIHPGFLPPPFGDYCEKDGELYTMNSTRSIDLSGSSITDQSGKSTWRFTNYTCLPYYHILADPVSFVATPVTDKPTYLTVTYELQATSPRDERKKELVVQVYSWDKQGNPCPYVSYCWRCRLLYHEYAV